jgi:hypothetical protein
VSEQIIGLPGCVSLGALRNVEDLLAERGIDISHETVRF